MFFILSFLTFLCLYIQIRQHLVNYFFFMSSEKSFPLNSFLSSFVFNMIIDMCLNLPSCYLTFLCYRYSLLLFPPFLHSFRLADFVFIIMLYFISFVGFLTVAFFFFFKYMLQELYPEQTNCAGCFWWERKSGSSYFNLARNMCGF